MDSDFFQARHLLDDRHFLPNLNVLHDDPALAYRLGALLMNKLLHEAGFLHFSHLRNTLNNPHFRLIILALHHNRRNFN